MRCAGYIIQKELFFLNRMSYFDAALLVNLLGFTVGVALYLLLAAMVFRHRGGSSFRRVDVLLFTTAILGLAWNVGELIVFVLRDFSAVHPYPFVTAAAYSALGFLPSVVVHAAQNEAGGRRRLSAAAYALSIFAAGLNFYSAAAGEAVPSPIALTTLTIGSVTLALGLVLSNMRQPVEQKAIWAAALLILAVSALHFVGEGEGSSWPVELVAHQSSLPLALVILYRYYRFAFADLFLKRAISLLLLAGVAFALYTAVAAPLLRYHETHDRNDVQAISLIITLWIATALIYPFLHAVAVILVDKVILQRADYTEFSRELIREIEAEESVAGVLDIICTRLAAVLTANRSEWQECTEFETTGEPDGARFTPDGASVIVATAESPHFRIALGDFLGGRRLLSEETAVLEAIALAGARRIDAIRVTQERIERELREQELARLAAEAKLTALRSQINPHFLFNALTTIGYLIQNAPEKAVQTLMQLTKLLRGALTATSEFQTLDEELKLIDSYLEIERTRLEDRLNVEIDVPDCLRSVRIPSLLIQPVVENAIKHGISANKKGGTISLAVGLLSAEYGDKLEITVFDTGSGGKTRKDLEGRGVGLSNIRDRLASHYGPDAEFCIDIDPKVGTRARILIPFRGHGANAGVSGY